MGVDVGVIMAFSLHRLVSMSAVHLFIIHLVIAYLLAFCSCVYSFLALLVEINERGLSHIPIKLVAFMFVLDIRHASSRRQCEFYLARLGLQEEWSAFFMLAQIAGNS